MKKLTILYLNHTLKKINRTFLLKFSIVIFVLFFLNFYSSKLFSLEVTIPLEIYEPLSKTVSTKIPGSSNIIIDREKIAKYDNIPIHTIIEKETGIKSRSIYGSNSSGSKTTIDIRGMGAQAKSNVLILINGQRLNNIDMSEIDFPSIPIDSVDRIEVYKGNAASVLYGDGAIGGVINIITSPTSYKNKKNKITTKVGSFNNRSISWVSSKEIDRLLFNAYFNHNETDGYRDENEQQQNNFSSEFRNIGDQGDHFITFSYSEQLMSTPSDRSQSQLYSDRRGSDTPDDFINSEGTSIFYGTDYKINSYTKFILNSSFRMKDSFSDLQSTSSPSYNETSLTNYQFTPRMNRISNLFGKINDLTYGLDIQYADYKSYRKETELAIPLHVYDAWQATQSAYFQNTLNLNNSTTLGTGFRIQRNNIGIGDHLDTSAPDYGGWQTEHKPFSDQEINYAINFGIDHKVNKNNKIFTRVGNGFRYPNIDDRIGGKGGTSLELDTQTTKDFEIGLELNYKNFFSNVSTYIIEGKNELAYDSDAFENINMNSTRRYGLELSTINKISDIFTFSNNFTISKANYTSGDQGSYATDFKGNQVPLVPLYSLDSSIEWQISKSTSIIPSIKYQDDMRMESDDENFQETKIPSYFLINLNISSKFGRYFSKLKINNLLNENYFNYAVASSSTLNTYNAYPEPGREIIYTFGLNF